MAGTFVRIFLSRNNKGAMKNIRSRPFWLSIGLIISDSLFFGLTNPVRVASIMLMVGFLLLMLTAYWLLYNVQKVLAVYAPWLRQQRKIVVVATCGLATIVALQSIGQLTARDGLLIPLALSAVYFYAGLNRRSANKS